MSIDWIKDTGYLGKLPGNGDFLSHNLDHNLHTFLDDMLSDLMEGLSTSPTSIENYFKASPVSLCMNTATAGVLQGFLMPSVDRAGRPFPWLVIRKNCDSCHSGWTNLIQDLSIRALDEDWSGDRFQMEFEKIVSCSPLVNFDSLNLHTNKLPSVGFLSWEKDALIENQKRIANCPPTQEQWSLILDA